LIHQSDQPVQAVEDVWLMAADGANPQRLVEKAGYTGWMPNAPAFIYLSLSDLQLYIYELEKKSSRRLTNEEGIYGSGVPSSDGRWVAYMSIGSGNVDIRAVKLRVEDRVRLSQHLVRIFIPSSHRAGNGCISYLTIGTSTEYRVRLKIGSSLLLRRLQILLNQVCSWKILISLLMDKTCSMHVAALPAISGSWISESNTYPLSATDKPNARFRI
jgi:hypothetical protein